MTSWPQTRYSLLARLANSDDDAAWQTFQAAYEPAIYRYARSRGLQEADALEVVQEVMIAVHRAMADWKPTHRAGSFRRWLAEAGRRLTLRALRQRQRRDVAMGQTSVLHTAPGRDAPPTRDDAAEDERRWAFCCAAAIVEGEVHESTWRAFWMTAVEGRPPAAAAAELGVSVGNVHTAKCRVLNRIRRRVQQRAGASHDAV